MCNRARGVLAQQENEDTTITSPVLVVGSRMSNVCLGLCCVVCCRLWDSINVCRLTLNYEKQFSCRTMEHCASWFVLLHNGSYKLFCSQPENPSNAISTDSETGWQPQDWDHWRSLHHSEVLLLWLENIPLPPQQTTKLLWRGSKAKCRSFHVSNYFLGKHKKSVIACIFRKLFSFKIAFKPE